MTGLGLSQAVPLRPVHLAPVLNPAPLPIPGDTGKPHRFLQITTPEIPFAGQRGVHGFRYAATSGVLATTVNLFVHVSDFRREVQHPHQITLGRFLDQQSPGGERGVIRHVPLQHTTGVPQRLGDRVAGGELNLFRYVPEVRGCVLE